MKRKRASRHVISSRPDEVDPLDPNTSIFGGLKSFTSKSYGPQALQRRREEVEQRYVTNLLSLGQTTRKLLDDLQAGAEGSQSATDDKQPGDDEDDDTPMVVDSGDAGNDPNWVDVDDSKRMEEMVQIRDILAMRRVGYRPKDERTWGLRIQTLHENWKPLLPKLVDAFLLWRHQSTRPKGAHSSPPPPPASASASVCATASAPMSASASASISTSAPAPPDGEPTPTDSPSFFSIDVLDFYTLEHVVDIPMPATCETRAEALVLSGYLGTVPLQPSLAISLKTLELLRSIRMFKASFSIEGFAKLLCHYYSVPYRRAYRSALSDAFDIYLHLVREVAAGVSRSLGRDTPNWRVLNACPPCSYKLQGEPALLYARMYAMDGNNSLKRLAPLGGRQAGDTRVFSDSDYFLPQSFVDKFANEVRSKPAPTTDAADAADDDDTDDTAEHAADTGEIEGDPTDGAAVISSCTKNWKAAAADEKKRAWGIFDETGSFASACRHGLVLWLVDMVRSGELAKYPLSIVAKILEVIPDPTLGGFDIGCTFEGTVKASSLGPAFIKSGSRICVNAFHGYSHNYQCQLRNHPNILRGIGLEDLELMERLFSASNHLAPIVRYASAYRRRVLIDAFFRHWDEEKYQNLGLMLYNNYRQALEILTVRSIELSDNLTAIDATVDDLRRYRQEELQYFDHLGEEHPEDLHAVAYVELLQELNKTNSELDDVEEQFLASVPANYTPTLLFLQPVSGATTYEADASATRKSETRRRFLRERQAALTLEVTALEVSLGIKDRWQPGDPQYIKVTDYIASRKYHRALGVLQRLVVQRLFELHRLNLAQTGYRVRTHIAKHLQTRCRAIRNAVKNYNAAASALKPPRPPLDWATVSQMSFVEEFELLNDTRGDLRDKPWRQPLVREAMRTAHRLERAQEEVQRLNVEVRRLHTAIRDEDALFSIVLDDLESRGDIWYGPVLDHATRRRRVNARLLAYAEKIYRLEGFTGDAEPGQRVGAVFPALLSQSELRARAAISTNVPPPAGLHSSDAASAPSPPEPVSTSALPESAAASALARPPSSWGEQRCNNGVAANTPGLAREQAALAAAAVASTPDTLVTPVHGTRTHDHHAPSVSEGTTEADATSPPVPVPSTPPALTRTQDAATPHPSSRPGDSSSDDDEDADNVLDVHPRFRAREADVLNAEDDDFEEQATAYSDFIASIL